MEHGVLFFGLSGLFANNQGFERSKGCFTQQLGAFFARKIKSENPQKM
jgi:hypothetical protein